MIMKSSNQHILETLIINKDYSDASISPKSFDELRKIIEDRYDKLGPGTEQNPIDFNDIDVSNLDSFCKKNNEKGIFEKTKFEYIDISDWDVSNVTYMRCMFYGCEALKSVGDLSNWDVSNVTDISGMFYDCASFNQDISCWNVSSVTGMASVFCRCRSLNQDLSKWDVSNVNDMSYMFYGCESFNKDISSWDVSNVEFKGNAFRNCPIKEEYKPKFK